MDTYNKGTLDKGSPMGHPCVQKWHVCCISFITLTLYILFLPSVAWWLCTSAVPQWNLSGSGVLAGWAKGRAGGLSAGRLRVRVAHVPFIPNSLSLFTSRKYLKQQDPRALSYTYTYFLSFFILIKWGESQAVGYGFLGSTSSWKVWSTLESRTRVPSLPQQQLFSHCMINILVFFVTVFHSLQLECRDDGVMTL